MQIDEACALLGVEPGASAHDVRLRFHEQMRVAHPDVATSNRDNDRETDPALLTRANEVLRRAIAESADGRVPRIVDTDRFQPGIDRLDRDCSRRRPLWAVSVTSIELSAFSR